MTQYRRGKANENENTSKTIILCFFSFFQQKLDCLSVAEAYMTWNI